MGAARYPEGFSRKPFPNDVAGQFLFKKFHSLSCLSLVSLKEIKTIAQTSRNFFTSTVLVFLLKKIYSHFSLVFLLRVNHPHFSPRSTGRSAQIAWVSGRKGISQIAEIVMGGNQRGKSR
jgi:hypothetical protein